jgi:hypothetical protein
MLTVNKRSLPTTFDRLGELRPLRPLRPIKGTADLRKAQEVVDRLAVLDRRTRD